MEMFVQPPKEVSPSQVQQLDLCVYLVGLFLASTRVGMETLVES